MLKLSKSELRSFRGDVLSLGAVSDAGEISAFSANEEIAYLKRLGEGKFLVVLKSVGETVITVRAGEERAEVRIFVREAKRSDPNGKWKIFVGDTHAHTSYSDGLATPYEVYQQVKEEEYFNFFTVTDHTELLDDDEFFETFAAADAYTDEGFTAFAGSESQVDLYHKNSIGLDQNDGGEIVVINKEGYSYSKDLDTFFSDIGENASGFAIVAHPHIMGYSEYPVVWNAFDPIHQTDARMLDLIRGKNADEAMGILKNTHKSASEYLIKLLNSAVANAENNFGMDKSKLYVSECFVCPGPTLKRMMPRARGSADRILKRTSHVTIKVAEKED